ncbi:pyridoxal-dependent decarboxylase [Streptomyces sp. DT2A-34]|uniref:pyridoxal phosphate-dependent decarboxylase family protein n=1 Tax=Streptomyces sp. DT2A-34 TaxID=3051182 RepID=UPI00265BA44C|nr:pyridoxal-dependent decarboxylase [Streptomyces sp. DT2A-34]MDO0914717.1 pyridoxal-dependent decarboxylase [Streptomyces sp. DT2A-34]
MNPATTGTDRRVALAGTADGIEQLRTLVDTALDAVCDAAVKRGGPVVAGGPGAAIAAVRDLVRQDGFLTGAPGPDRVGELFEAYATWAADLTHPAAVSRMQCAPTPAAVAAELLAAVLNQSLHSWESGPFALELERRLIREIAGWVGYDEEAASGTLTPGGSISNLMGLLLSRDHALGDIADGDVSQTGLVGQGARPRILCSAAAHFSIARAAGFLGLGRDAVVKVPVDDMGRMIPDEARRLLDGFGPDETPIALVATAGTTDHGSFDPLPELAALAAERRTWLHVDAAYGIGALFSQTLATHLDGLAEADSIAFDLHKFGWTPASSSVLLVRDRARMSPLTQQAVYLNPPDDEAEGYTALLGTSLQTTRRSDAFKIAASLLALGRKGMGDWVDACHAQARHAAARIAGDPDLELLAEPVLSTVIFRCRTSGPIDDESAWNAAVRRHLMAEGRALLARTKVRRPDGELQVHLKLVFLNPATTTAEIDALLDDVVTAATEVREARARAGAGRSAPGAE